jgi:hypothetical protein
MKKLIFLIYIVTLTSFSLAQNVSNPDFANGPQSISCPDVIGSDETGFYLLEKDEKKSEQKVSYLDWNFKLIASKSIPDHLDANNKNRVFSTLIFTRGQLYLFSSETNEGFVSSICYGQLVDKKTLDIKTDVKKLVTYSRGPETTPPSANPIKLSVSSDGAHFLFSAAERVDGKQKQFYFWVYDNNLYKEWESKNEYKGEGFFKPSDFKITGDGTIFNFNATELSLLTCTKKGMQFFETGIGDKILKEVSLTSDENNIYIAGLYSAELKNCVKGYFYSQVNYHTGVSSPVSITDFSAEMGKQIMMNSEMAPDIVGEIPFLSAKQLVKLSDGGIYFILENNVAPHSIASFDFDPFFQPNTGSMNVMRNGGGSTYSEKVKEAGSNAGDIIVIKFNKDQKIEWTKIIAKRQVAIPGNENYISYNSASNGSELYFVFNEMVNNEDSYDVNRKLKPAALQGSFDRMAKYVNVVCVKLNEKGEITRQLLTTKSSELRPVIYCSGSSASILNGQFIFPFAIRNGEIKVGKVEVK